MMIFGSMISGERLPSGLSGASGQATTGSQGHSDSAFASLLASQQSSGPRPDQPGKSDGHIISTVQDRTNGSQIKSSSESSDQSPDIAQSTEGPSQASHSDLSDKPDTQSADVNTIATGNDHALATGLPAQALIDAKQAAGHTGLTGRTPASLTSMQTATPDALKSAQSARTNTSGASELATLSFSGSGIAARDHAHLPHPNQTSAQIAAQMPGQAQGPNRMMKQISDAFAPVTGAAVPGHGTQAGGASNRLASDRMRGGRTILLPEDPAATGRSRRIEVSSHADHSGRTGRAGGSDRTDNASLIESIAATRRHTHKQPAATVTLGQTAPAGTGGQHNAHDKRVDSAVHEAMNGLTGAAGGMGANAPLAALPGSLANLGPGTVPLMANLSSPEWGTEFARRMTDAARDPSPGPKTIHIRVDPPELGPIRITLSMENHVMQASFACMHTGVRQAIENALPQLSGLLADAGLTLGQTDVRDQSQSQAQDGSPGQEARTHFAAEKSTTRTEAATTPQQRAATAADALIDTFV